MSCRDFNSEVYTALCGDWRFLEELIKAGKSTTAQRRQADEKQNAIKVAIDALVARRELAYIEGQLLQSELAHVMGQINASMPVDCHVRCYRMMVIPPVERSIEQVNVRIKFLNEGGGIETIKSSVLHKVLGALELDIAVLEKAGKRDKKANKNQYDQAYQDAKDMLGKIKALLAGK